MAKYIFALVVLALAFASLAVAHGQDFNETKKLLESRPDCKNLTDTQLEEIGEYYMEQMHPGVAHEKMHETMGLKEGSGEKVHITMAKNIYCGEGGMMGMLEPAEMMNMMMHGENRYSSGMGMSGYSSSGSSGGAINSLVIILLMGLIVLMFIVIVKLWKK